jgi:Fe-Mn family superoxide dismutase
VIRASEVPDCADSPNQREDKMMFRTRRGFLKAASALGVTGLGVGSARSLFAQTETTKPKEVKAMYQAKDYGSLIGMKGFSETLLKNHFTLYQGYVTNTNKLSEILVEMHKGGKTSVPEYAELKRRFGWEFNGMRLHEYYFENLGGSGQINASGPLAQKLSKAFGSVQNWESDFRGVGAMRGIGWGALYQDDPSGNLFNVWINEHDVGHLVGCRPLLILDVFEHAFMIDYGLKRADYIQAFFQNVKWDAVEKRL